MATARIVGPEAIPLERVSPADIGALVEIERLAWRDVLGWDAPTSAATMARAIEWGILRGAALCTGGRPVAYLALQPGIGETRLCGVHLPPEVASAAPALVGQALLEAPAGSRVEGQLIAFAAQPELDRAFRNLGLSVEPRDFLELRPPLASGAEAAKVASSRPPGAALRVSRLVLADLEGCARVLVEAHVGGVEARINRAFQSESAARVYLREVVEASGCGRVSSEASSVASIHGRVVGFCLATTTSPGVGHVPQIALTPALQGQGCGTTLLSHAIARLAADGCERVTLSVSRANARASAWYRRRGFRTILPFASYHRDGLA